MGLGRFFLVNISAALLGCGPSLLGEDGGMDGTRGDDEGSNPDPTSDFVPPPPSLGMGHGVVELELRRSENEIDDPFLGTARVEITMLYRECLIDFYGANPSWRQEGSDGSEIFALAMSEGLCDPSDPTLVECTVASITQALDTTQSMMVVYDVTGPLEERHLRFGPLPSVQIADCADGELPIVRMIDSESARGFDATGTAIWMIESFNPAEAATDQGAALIIKVTRS